MGKSPGNTQLFIIEQLVELPDEEWMPVQELIKRFAEHKGRPIDNSVEFSVRNAYHRLTNPMAPRAELGWVNSQRCIRLTAFGRIEHTNPWAIKQREMPEVWRAIQAEQLREIRKAKR